jgi:hypothetical protein
MSGVKFTRARLCQIAKWPATWDEPRPPCCGAPATWWSDDLAEGQTVWMCDEHQTQMARDVDYAEFGEEKAS